jgi:hypothetical protein
MVVRRVCSPPRVMGDAMREREERGEVERGEGGARKDRESVPVLFTMPGRGGGGGARDLGPRHGIRVVGLR